MLLEINILTPADGSNHLIIRGRQLSRATRHLPIITQLQGCIYRKVPMYIHILLRLLHRAQRGTTLCLYCCLCSSRPLFSSAGSYRRRIRDALFRHTPTQTDSSQDSRQLRLLLKTSSSCITPRTACGQNGLHGTWRRLVTAPFCQIGTSMLAATLTWR